MRFPRYGRLSALAAARQIGALPRANFLGTGAFTERASGRRHQFAGPDTERISKRYSRRLLEHQQRDERTQHAGRRIHDLGKGGHAFFEQVSSRADAVHAAADMAGRRVAWRRSSRLPGKSRLHSVPTANSRRNFTLTTRGTTVIVLDEKRSQPTIAAHPGIVLMSELSAKRYRASLQGDFDWNPERSPKVLSPSWRAARIRPSTFIAMGSNWLCDVSIRESASASRRAGRTMLEGLADGESTFVPGRPARS